METGLTLGSNQGKLCDEQRATLYPAALYEQFSFKMGYNCSFNSDHDGFMLYLCIAPWRVMIQNQLHQIWNEKWNVGLVAESVISVIITIMLSLSSQLKTKSLKYVIAKPKWEIMRFKSSCVWSLGTNAQIINLLKTLKW